MDIPWQELAIDAEWCGKLYGKAPRTFLETIACQPGFPKRVSYRPAAWRAGDVVEYRNANLASPPVRRQSSDSK